MHRLQEGTMHTHRNQMNLGVTNPYMAAAAQKIAASERAAKVRKKLLKSAAPAGFGRDFCLARNIDPPSSQSDV